MFLDDKLEAIYNEGKACGKSQTEIGTELLNECWARVKGDKNPETSVEIKNWLNNLRKVEWYWRLFARKHKGEFREDGFKEIVLNRVGEHREMFKRNLKW